tara:strand:- start:4737 stop:4946 length:210 start_codon:yes stop_codon:yes gene_type:complete
MKKETTDVVECLKCGMSFKIGTPPKAKGERTICGEETCDRPMISIAKNGPNHAVMYMDPHDYLQWVPEL